MPTLNAALDIAKSALLASQKAIDVSAHNTANANTEGYTRQVVVQEAMDPVNYGGLVFGTGVSVNNIQRVYDNFLTVQLRNSNSQSSRYDANDKLVQGLQSVINDFNGAGLQSGLDGFFNAMQDVANSPSTYPERAVLLSKASILADGFTKTDGLIRTNIDNANKEMLAQVDSVNAMASQIADLNQQISTTETNGVSANDLRDKRDLVLDKLAKIVDITTSENSTGQVDVYISGGPYLVAGVRTAKLGVNVNNSDPAGYDLVSNGEVLNSRISGGSLKGIIDGVQSHRDMLDKLNLLAASLTKQINLQHRAGYGLDGSTNNDFFVTPPVYTKAAISNTGGAIVSSTAVSNLALTTLNDYEVRFVSTANYSVVNKTTGAVVTNGAYASGNPITFDGLSVTVSDSGGGPQAGDSFAVSLTKNAARGFKTAITDPNKFAASATAAGAPGDNANVLSLAALKDAATVNGSTFGDYYRKVITELGTKANEVSGNADVQKKVTEQLKAGRDSISGVSVEEEAVNLIKLQRAFEAAAKVMKTVDSMYDTLLSIR